MPCTQRTAHSAVCALSTFSRRASPQSQKDRTLDQQCTVTRPGVSSMAASLAVELFVAVMHHKDGGRAPAEVTEETESGLGLLPHQIRGFLCTYKEVLVNVEACVTPLCVCMRACVSVDVSTSDAERALRLQIGASDRVGSASP